MAGGEPAAREIPPDLPPGLPDEVGPGVLGGRGAEFVNSCDIIVPGGLVVAVSSGLRRTS